MIMLTGNIKAQRDTFTENFMFSVFQLMADWCVKYSCRKQQLKGKNWI